MIAPLNTVKKALLLFAITLGLSNFAQAQQVSIDAGLLENADGTTTVQAGGLLQLIASSSGNFSAPTSSSYVTGDNVLVGSQPTIYNQQAGETNNTFNIALSASVPVGAQLLLRFYPSLTFANTPATPTLGTTYGQVRSSTIEFGAAGNDPTETGWFVPAAGASVDLDYITVSAGGGGTYANNTAFASNTISAVPEPSTYGMFAGALVSFMFLRVWKRGCAAI